MLHWEQNVWAERAGVWVQWKLKLTEGMLQLAGGLQTMGLQEMNDGIHSIGRAFTPQYAKVGWPSTPGCSTTTQKDTGK
jgi:hypothetical protein